jgi:2'-5' RNA ligase
VSPPRPGPDVRRLFFAVDPPGPACDDLAAALEPLRSVPGAPRWTDPGRWHLTLLFLGAVPAGTLPALVERAGPAVAQAPPMTLRLCGGGRFGSLRRPQVAWTGLDGDVAPLTSLAARLAAAARSLRLEVEERPFRAHLTLGRWRPGQRADGTVTDRLADYRGPDWPVTEVRLVESRLGPAPTHETLAAWPVGG